MKSIAEFFSKFTTVVWLAYFAIAEALSCLPTSPAFKCILVSEHNNPKDNTGYYACATMHEAIIRGIGFLWENATHDNISAFAAIAIAVFTFTLWRSTNQLWEAGERQLVQLRESSERELRAYVSVRPFKLEITPEQLLHFEILQLNIGKTPAYSVSSASVIELMHYPLPEDFPFPTLPTERGSTVALFPNIESYGHVLAARPFTGEEYLEIFRGNRKGVRLFIYGQIDYLDAFKKPHWTRFCFSFPGWSDFISLIEADHLDEVVRLLPHAPLHWEATKQHNLTDEG